MFLGKDGDRTIFQIMTRHGVDIGAFSVRSPPLASHVGRERTGSDEERAWRRWLRVLLVAGHPVGGGGASPRRNHPQGALVMHDAPGGLEALTYIAIAVGDGSAAEECGRPDDRHPDRRRGRAVHGSLSRGPEGLEGAS